MSTVHSCSFRILWITLQMVLALIGPHPENASPYLPYVSEFQYIPQYHPSRNPDCMSQRYELYNENFEYERRKHSLFKEPLINHDHPRIEIRAVLTRCSKTRREIETSRSSRNCRRKMVISMKINNVGKTNTQEEFILVDHVLDSVTMHKIRLRNPYVIKIRQEPLLHLYGLRLQGVVNAEAREEVINNHRANFTGCNDGLDNPTCGQMLVDGEPIPFSQGFCCSCEDAQRAESFRSVAAKSNYYQRDELANRARNRSLSSADLFDNLEARRQVEPESRKEEYNRQVGSENARERVTSRNTFAVNGPLGERTSPFRKQQFKNNSIQQRPLEGSLWAKNANRTESSSSVSNGVLSDLSPSEGKIEAAVYQQAMKGKAAKEAIKQESDTRNKDLLEENDLSLGGFLHLKDRLRESDPRMIDRRISDKQSLIYDTVTGHPEIETRRFMNKNYDFKESTYEKFNPQSVDRFFIRVSVANDRRSPARLTELKGEWNFTKMDSKKDNRKFSESEKRDTSVNFSESGNCEEMAKDRFRGVTQLENTFDYTPTSLAIHSSRIPEESQFSRRTEKNAFPDDNTSLDNGSFSTTVESFIRSGIFGNNSDENNNYGTASSTTNNFEANVLALLSKIIMSETRSWMERGEGGRYGFRTPKGISDNINALKNASIVRENLSAAANRGNDTSGEERKTENANVSTQISTVPAFIRLRNLSFPGEVPRLRESISASRAITIASVDGSLAKILESGARGSLSKNEVQGSPDNFGNLNGNRQSRGMYNSPERASTNVNLKNSYKFWPHRKLRKSKGAEKFYGDKSGEKLKRFGKSNRMKLKRASPDFERDGSRNEFPMREKRFRRRLRTGKEVFNIVNPRSNDPMDKTLRRKTQVFVDHYARPEIVHSKRKNNGGNKSPKKQVILESGHSYKKIQPDNPFYDKTGKESSVDKRIEDKFARISNVLKEDSEMRIIQETPENFKVVTTSEVAKADISEVQDEPGDDLFSRKGGKTNELFTIHDDEVTREQSAKLNNTHQRWTTMIKNEVAATASPKDSTRYKKISASSKSIVNPFSRLSNVSKFDYNISNRVNFNKSKVPIYTTNLATTKVSTRKSLPYISHDEDHLEVTYGPLEALSNNWTNNSRKTDLIVNNKSKNEREKILFGIHKKPSAGNYDPQGPSIDSEFSLRGNASMKNADEISHIQDLPSETVSEKSQREEIAALVDRIVRQYTPIMPGMPTFDEITEAETLPMEEDTTIARFATTTSATTTRITDAVFRPSIRPLQATPFPGELHDEISLDETTFVDETEATTTSPGEEVVPKSKFNTSTKTKLRKGSSKSGKNEKQRRKIRRKITKEKIEDHPWHRTTEMQRIIEASRSKPIRKIEAKKKHRYKPKMDYFRNTSSRTSSTMISSGVAQKRGKRSVFICAPGNRNSTVFYMSEDEEARRSERRGLNKNEKSPNVYITESTELRSTIEKRLASELDYLASRRSSRHSCESRAQTQKLNGALQDIAARNGLRTVKDNLSSDDSQKKEQDMRGNPKNCTLLKPRRMKDDVIRKFDEDISSDREVAFGISGLAKIPPSNLSRSIRERLMIDRGSERQVFSEQMATERNTMARKVVVNESREREKTASANDLSDRSAESRQRSSAGRILPIRVKTFEDRDKRGTNTVIRDVKLMMPDGEDTMRDDVGAKSIHKNISPQRRKRREDARKINENPADRRASVGKRHRRPRGKVHEIIKKTKRKLSSASNETDIEKSIERSEKHVGRSPQDLHRLNRRLLSSIKSSHIESIGDEYYANGESEIDGENDWSDNKAIAKRDDLSYLENQSGQRKDRDLRKLEAEADQLADGNAEERTTAACDAAMLSGELANSEEAISRSANIENKVDNKNTDFQDTKVISESTDLPSFNEYEIFEAPLEAKEEPIIQNNISEQETNVDNSENISKNSQKEINKPLSVHDKNNLQDESSYDIQPIFNTKKIINSSATNNKNLLNTTEILKNEGNIKISLTGRIHVHGGFNRTPMLINFVAIPDASSVTQFSISTESAIRTVVNLLSNDSNAESDTASMNERTNDEASDTLSNEEIEKTDVKKNPFEKRMDKYNTTAKLIKQVYLMNYLTEPKDKLASHSSTNPVYFPDIFGSILINNNSLKNQNAIQDRVDKTATSDSTSDSIESNATFRITLVNVDTEKPSDDLANDERTKTTCCLHEDPRNATFHGCYGMPLTVRKLAITMTTPRELQTSNNYRNGDPTFPSRFYELTARDGNAESLPSTRLQSGIPRTAANSASSRCNGGPINAIRARNMMAIVGFMMKLLKIVAKEPPCPRADVGEQVIHEKNIVINASSHVERQEDATDDVIKSGGAKQDLASTEWRSAVTEEPSFSGDGSFDSFTEAPEGAAGEVSKDEEPSTFFEAFTGKEVYASTLSSTTPSVTLKSFLFYEPARKSPRKDASWKNITVELTSVKQNPNLPSKGSKDESGKKFRLDGGQTNRSRSRDRDRNSADRLHFGKQGIASATNPENKIALLRDKHSARNKNIESRRSESMDSRTIRPKLARDIDASQNVLSEKIVKENKLDRSTSRRKAVSERRGETGTKLLNRSTRGGPAGDWIGEHRTARRRLSIDKKLRRRSCKVPGGTAMPGKVVFRRVCGKINRPPDPNLVSGGSDSFKIQGNVAGSSPLAKLSNDDALSVVEKGLSSLKRENTPGNAIQYSTSLSMKNNVGAFNGRIADKRARIPHKKRDVSERRDFPKGNRVLGKASSTTEAEQRRKKKRKKGSRRTRDISGTEKQRRFKRRLLTTSLEPEYDADDTAARRYVATKRREIKKFRKSARRRRKRDESPTVDESEVGAAQIRGGQDCADRRHPPNIDAAEYLESAHCLRFSDLWYSVYRLENPIVEHAVYLQVYEKRTSANGSTYWEDLTGDPVVRLGTFNRHHRGNRDTIAFAYKEVKMLEPGEAEVPNLDVVRDRILVPSSVTSKGSEYPGEDDPGEYLVVPASGINESGNECDRAGVGFAAFARQPDRCGRVRGTCLKNQPLAYRRHDAEARAAGRPGCYFLSNFASIPNQPIKYSANGSGSHEFLALEYHSPHVSAIDIEVETGNKAAPVGGSLGRINEVHVDSTALNHTIVTIIISNMGWTSMLCRLRIVKCPDDLPKSWVNATFPRNIIQSQRNQIMSVDLYGELPLNEFHCSVQLLNRFGGLVAARKIKIRKTDRCSCMLHRLCVCSSDTSNTHCKPEFHHIAGFRSLTISDKIFAENILFFIILSILLLVFMGFLKWLIGLYVSAIGRWGLDSLLQTRGISEYHERELKHKCVVTDEHGAPVHPDTRKRTVRICSRKAEFFLNTMFFLIFPFAICCVRLKKLFHRPVRRRCCSNESKISLTSDRSERPKTICVSTYGDSRDSRMEAEDTQYVIEELKKSEESLRSRIKSKVRKT